MLKFLSPNENQRATLFSFLTGLGISQAGELSQALYPSEIVLSIKYLVLSFEGFLIFSLNTYYLILDTDLRAGARSSPVERVICNDNVGGSTPLGSTG